MKKGNSTEKKHKSIDGATVKLTSKKCASSSSGLEIKTNSEEVSVNKNIVNKTITETPKKLLKFPRIRLKNGKFKPIKDTKTATLKKLFVTPKKAKNKILITKVVNEAKSGGTSKVTAPCAIQKSKLWNLADTKIPIKSVKKVVTKAARKQKSTVRNTEIANDPVISVKKIQKPKIMKLCSNLDKSQEIVEDKHLNIEEARRNYESKIEIRAEDKKQINYDITSNNIKSKLAKLRLKKTDEESCEKQSDSGTSCVGINDKLSMLPNTSAIESHFTNSAPSRKRKRELEEKCHTNSNTYVIPQQGNNFKITVKLDRNKLPVNLQSEIEEKLESIHLKAADTAKSCLDSHIKVSETNEELQPVDKKLNVDHVDSTINYVVKTYSSKPNKDIQQKKVVTTVSGNDDKLEPINKKINLDNVDKTINSVVKAYSSTPIKSMQQDKSIVTAPISNHVKKNIDYVIRRYSDVSNEQPSVKQIVKTPYVRLEQMFLSKELQQQAYNLNSKLKSSVPKKILKNNDRLCNKNDTVLEKPSLHIKKDRMKLSNTISNTVTCIQPAKYSCQERTVTNEPTNILDSFTNEINTSTSITSEKHRLESIQDTACTSVLNGSISSSNSSFSTSGNDSYFANLDVSSCQQRASLHEPDSSTIAFAQSSGKNIATDVSNISISTVNSSLNNSNSVSFPQKETSRKTPDSSITSSCSSNTSINMHSQRKRSASIADSSTSFSESPNTSLGVLSIGDTFKREQLINVADSSTSSIDSPNTAVKQSESQDTGYTDVLVNSYSCMPALLNIKITRNVTTNNNDRIIQLIPQPEQPDYKEVEYRSSTPDDYILDYSDYKEDKTVKNGRQKMWSNIYYEFTDDEIIKIFSQDQIFEDAVLDSSNPANTAAPYEDKNACISKRKVPIDIPNKNLSNYGKQERTANDDNNFKRSGDLYNDPINNEWNGQSLTKNSASCKLFPSSTIMKQDITFRKTPSTTSEDNESDASQRPNFQFKKPLLPPAKRPPTRMKSYRSDTSSNRSRSPDQSEASYITTSTSNTSETSVNASHFARSLNINNQIGALAHENDNAISQENDDAVSHENDDAISLYAGTIKESDFDDPHPSKETQYLTGQEQPKKLEDSLPQNIANCSAVPTETAHLESLATNLLVRPVNLPEQNIMKWIASTEEARHSHLTNTKEVRQSHREIPSIYKAICLLHFNRECSSSYCRRSHDIPWKMEVMIKNLPYEKLVNAYKFTKERYMLYTRTIHYFIRAFDRRGSISDILNLVNDILNIKEMFDRTPFIREIITSLKNKGLSFLAAVEIIVAQQSKNIALSDILLYIICVQYKEKLSENWYLIQKLIDLRNYKLIDHHLVEDMMTQCCNKKKLELSKSVFRDIIRQEIVDLRLISERILNNFVSLLHFLKLFEEERELVNLVNKYHIRILPKQPERLSPMLQQIPSESRFQDAPFQCNRTSPEQNLLQNDVHVPSNDKYNTTENMPNLISGFNEQNSYLEKQNPLHVEDLQTNNSQVVPKTYVKFVSTPSTSVWQLQHSDGNTSSSNKISKNDSEPTVSQNVMPNGFPTSQRPLFGTDELQQRRFSKDSNVIPHNTEMRSNRSTLSSKSSTNDFESNFFEDLYSTERIPFERNQVMPQRLVNVNNKLDCATYLNLSASASSIFQQSSVINRDVSNNKGIQNDVASPADFQHNLNRSITSSSSSSVTSLPEEEFFDNAEKSLIDSDVKLLSDIIAQEKLIEFFAMFNTFKESPLSESFVVNIIGLFKRKTPVEIYNMSLKIFNGLEHQDSNYIDDENMTRMVHMLVVNIVALLEQRRSFQEAAQLLVKFRKNLVGLTQTKWLRSIHRHGYSEVGKYLHFCRIFVKGGYLKEAADLFMLPELKLLYGSNMWTLQCYETFDVEFRNNVVQELIVSALNNDIALAKEVILQMITDKNHITEISTWKYFNCLILNMLNGDGAYMEDIKSILPNIIQGWYKFLSKPVMRGLVVQLVVSDVPNSDLIKLYKKCCKQKVYEPITGKEGTLLFKTDMTAEEIYMTIHYLFTKMVKCNFPLREITINIKLSDSVSNHPNMLLNSEVKVQSLKARVYNVLARSFKYAINVQINENEPYIKISSDQIRQCINYYKKSNGIPTCSSFWVRQIAIEQLQNKV